MSSKRHKIEVEIIRIRNDGNLLKHKDIIKQLAHKCGDTDPVVKYLDNFVKIHEFFIEHESDTVSALRNSTVLDGFKNKLTEARKQNFDPKDSLVNVFIEASLLLAKLCYSQASFQECVDIYSNVNLAGLENSVTDHYMVIILCEAFAINGLCLERSRLKDPKFKSDVEALGSYETAQKLFMRYIHDHHRLDSTSTSPTSPASHNMDIHIYPAIESCLHRTASLYIKSKTPEKAVSLYKTILTTLPAHIPSQTHQKFLHNLASVLIRGFSKISYKQVSTDTHERSIFFQGVKNVFIPNYIQQEALLLLLITEGLLNLDPVLDMSPEHAESREQTLMKAESLYDDLSVAVASHGQYHIFTESIERSLKYNFDRYHLWNQFALSLCAEGKIDRGVQCLAECCRIDPTISSPDAILASRLCYTKQPPQIDAGLKYAELALEHSDEDHDGLRSRSHLYIGLGCSLKALGSLSKKDRLEYRAKAIKSYTSSHTSDPYDYKPLFHLSFELALSRKVAVAIKKVKQALELQPEACECLHLLALLLSARKLHSEAKVILQSALKLYPSNISLLTTKCRLELCLMEEQDALRTCDEIITLCNRDSTENKLSNSFNQLPVDGVSVANQSTGTELEVGSLLNSVMASRIDRVNSDVESLMGVIHPMLPHMWSGKCTAWVQVADVYLALERYQEAELCVAEAAGLQPLLPDVLYMKGRLCEYNGELDEACSFYNSALTIDPSHLESTEKLAKVLSSNGNICYAKKVLQDAIRLDATSHTVWQQLSDLLAATDEIDQSIECNIFALNLEASSPVLPYTCIVPFI
uniref:Tetratricopeptide repeat protein 7B-like n=1 Tax=Ciona intestinalis TaxID=7719 RepID=H2XMH4_CIOIN|nr:tetratricopeptide repeat protein 7B-like [Ciona intestinalis]|eukprot:XP_002125603.1 tetratricopeptide repeat protein 7B-like [Ciona intestinalis]